MAKEILNISGMTCAACAQRIEKVVSRQQGVAAASVNLAAEQLAVEYDSGVISIEEIQAVGGKVGFSIINVSYKNLTPPTNREVESYWVRAIIQKKKNQTLTPICY